MVLFVLLVLGFVGPLPSSFAATPRILKVLPHLLDEKGRISLSPSLYERDAYQALLRRDRARCTGVRFDVQWKASLRATSGLRLRLELLTTASSKDRPIVLEQPVAARAAWGRWTRIHLRDQAFREAGELIAWRATLWDGDRELASQQSFLW